MRSKCGKGKIDIIDDEVQKTEKDSEEKLALSKKDFAEYISKRSAPFESVDFESFLPIFEIIREILIAENALIKNAE